VRAASLAKEGTVAYRYLHRAVSHLYQRVGAKAVSAFASYVNEELNKGTLRRLRGTKTKYEVFFNRRDATKLLNDNFFLNDNTCRSGLVRALAAVFASFNALQRFSESGETPADSRVVACRLGYFALVSTKVRAHLKTRAAAKSRDADDGGVTDDDNNGQGEEDNDEDRGRGGVDDGENDDGDEDAGGRGQMAVAEALNGGHRPEWVDELPIVDGVLRPQGAGAVNGLRIVDSLQADRLDTSRPPPRAPPSSGNPPPPTPSRISGPNGEGRRETAAELAQAASGQRNELPPREPDNEEDESDDWSTADDAEDPPRRRRRTTEEAREAASRRAAARVLMDHDT